MTKEFKRLGSLSITWLPREKYFVCWRPHTSELAGDRKAVLKFARWPASTPTGQALREWLDELTPQIVEPDNTKELAATGFGPEHHGDEPDPTQNTRMIT